MKLIESKKCNIMIRGLPETVGVIDKEVVSKEEFINTVHQFNGYLKDISLYVRKSNKRDSKKIYQKFNEDK